MLVWVLYMVRNICILSGCDSTVELIDHFLTLILPEENRPKFMPVVSN